MARQTVVDLVRRLTGVNEEEIEADLDARIQDEELFSVQRNREFLFLPSMYQAERYIALRLSILLQNRIFVSRYIDKMIEQVERDKGIE